MGKVLEEILSEVGDVHVVVPAGPEYLRSLRLVAADAAIRSGFDWEDVEDFRIAVDELCDATMRAADHHLHLAIRSLDDKVIAQGSALRRSPLVEPGLTVLSTAILTGTSDFFDFSSTLSEISFVVVKYRRTPMVDAE